MLAELVVEIQRMTATGIAMSQAAAERIGMNATQLNCMSILSFSGPMSAGELAAATGLTTASITAVLDRLEQMDFIRRERDPRDRRRLVVQLNVANAATHVMPTFRPVIRAWTALLDGYTDEQVSLLLDFYRRNHAVMEGQLVTMREAPQDAPGAGD